jgi:hypothetical protein
MELIKRYLVAVEFCLPKVLRADILRELSEDIHAEMADRESELGRPLTESDVEALLKKRGHPAIVATSFLPKRHLIGPSFFPFYEMALKGVALFCVIPRILVFVGMILFSPEFRLEVAGFGLFRHIGGIVNMAFGFLVAVTVLFALLEYYRDRLKFLENWDPKNLPKLPEKREPSDVIPRSTSFGELLGGMIFLAWWSGAINWAGMSPKAPHPVLNGAWEPYYWPIWAVTFAGIALASFKLWKPFRRPLYAWMTLAVKVAMIAIAVPLLRVGTWVDVVSSELPQRAILGIADGINLGIGIALIVVVAQNSVEAFQEARRLFRRAKTSVPSGGTAIVA